MSWAPTDAAAQGRLRRRHVASRAAAVLCVALAVVAAFPLFSVLFNIVDLGAGAINWEFLSTEGQGPYLPGGGIWHAIIGSGMVVGLGTLLGAPAGLLVGTYLAETNGRLVGLVRTVVDALAGMPSIVAGLFAYAVVVTRVGLSAWAGAWALAVLMLPTVTRTTEEALRTVPQAYRDASLALGAPRWRTIFFVVFPAAWSAVLTGLLLGVSRIAGETAPLVVTVLTSTFVSTDPGQPVATLPVLIYDYGRSAYPKLIEQAWGAALVLIALVLALNLLVRGLSALRERRLRG